MAAPDSRVEVAGGSKVGVGCGTRIFWFTLKGQSTERLFNKIMLCTETLKKAAIVEQKSPDLTVYSMGGSGVRVGVSVGMGDSVGVGVVVDVAVAEGMGVGTTTRFVNRSPTKTIAAPTAKTTASNPRAVGRLNRTSGMRVPCTARSDLAFVFGVGLNSLPHTTQRIAFSAIRVPQVGQILVGEVSGLIRRAIIPPLKSLSG